MYLHVMDPLSMRSRVEYLCRGHQGKCLVYLLHMTLPKGKVGVSGDRQLTIESYYI